MTLGEVILAVVNFIVEPTWHLVVFFVILLLIVAWEFYDMWINKGIS